MRDYKHPRSKSTSTHGSSSVWKQWIALAGVVATIIVGLPAAFQSIQSLFEPSGTTARLHNVDAQVLSSNDDPLFTLFTDKIDPSKTNFFTENCLTQVTVNNFGNNGVTLTKIIFEVEDIEVDETPRLSVSASTRDEERRGITVWVGNHGWGDANGITLTFSCDDPLFEEVFGFSSFERRISNLSAGKSSEMLLLQDNDVIGQPDPKKYFQLSMRAQCEQWGELEVDSVGVVFSVIDGKIMFSGGLGGHGNTVYGIFVDTSLPTFEFSEDIMETIEPHNAKSFPICFFPDKSSSMRCRMGFEVSHGLGNDEIIYTDEITAHFVIDSIWSGNRINVATVSPSELEEKLRESQGAYVAVTYPFVGIDEGNGKRSE